MQPQWVDYACHADAPWLTDRLRRRIQDFVTVLRCRYPTVQDLRSPDWAKRGLEIIQRPTEMEFGLTFVALDPDGHRLRVYALPQQ